MDLRPQTPAVGIMLLDDFDHTKFYKIECTCGDENHSVIVQVEADKDTEITVIHYTTEYTDFWHNRFRQEKSWAIKNTLLFNLNYFIRGWLNSLAHRIKITWDIWVKGHIKYQGSINMNQQQALNYANTIKQAIKSIQKTQNKGTL